MLINYIIVRIKQTKLITCNVSHHNVRSVYYMIRSCSKCVFCFFSRQK